MASAGGTPPMAVGGCLMLYEVADDLLQDDRDSRQPLSLWPLCPLLAQLAADSDVAVLPRQPLVTNATIVPNNLPLWVFHTNHLPVRATPNGCQVSLYHYHVRNKSNISSVA